MAHIVEGCGPYDDLAPRSSRASHIKLSAMAASRTLKLSSIPGQFDESKVLSLVAAFVLFNT